MQFSDLIYDYPEHLVALKPQSPSRVLWVEDVNPRFAESDNASATVGSCDVEPQKNVPQEMTLDQLLEKIPAGDVLVLNNTKVLKRRIFAQNYEILFLSHSLNRTEWEVLFPSKGLKEGAEIPLPLNKKMTLIKKGRPQTIKTDKPLTEDYFEQVAELPLPPYIQKARGERHNISEDQNWYQTAWAEKPGSLAAPTASLHLKEKHLQILKQRGIQIETLTLHVGLGTFLPLTEEMMQAGALHKEFVEISAPTWERLKKARTQNKKIWALGTTVTRSLESAALLEIQKPQLFATEQKELSSSTLNNITFETDLFIRPGFEFKMVDRLMTNFHQPESSLLSLVMAFAGIDKVKQAYTWAIKKEFKLFSYGDFSVWIK